MGNLISLELLSLCSNFLTQEGCSNLLSQRQVVSSLNYSRLYICQEGRHYREHSRKISRLSFILYCLQLQHMQITSLNLMAVYKDQERFKGGHHPLSTIDSGQRKIPKLQRTFTLNSQVNVNKKNKRSLVPHHVHKSSLSRRVMTSLDRSSPDRDIYFLDKKQKSKIPKNKAHQPKMKESSLNTIQKGHSYSLRFEKDSERPKSKRQNFKSEEKFTIEPVVVTDRLTSQMLKIRKHKSTLQRIHRSELMLRPEQDDVNRINQTERLNKQLYFQRVPIIRFSSKRHPEFQKKVEQALEETVQKDVLESQRSILMKEMKIKEEGTDRKDQNLGKIPNFLQDAKQKELIKVINRRKSQMNSNLIGRKYNPYFSYLTMNKKERKEFRRKEQVLDLDKNQISLDLGVAVTKK